MRRAMNKGKDRRIFSKTADKTKSVNISGKVTMRGGIRF